MQVQITKSARTGSSLVQKRHKTGIYKGHLGDRLPKDKAEREAYAKLPNITNDHTTVSKADFQYSELASNGGALVPEQAQTFYQVMIEEAVMLKEITMTPMRAPQERLDKVSFPTRIMRPGVDRQQLPASDRAKPTTSKIEMTTVEIVGEVRLGYQTIEDNIERGSFINRLTTMMAERVGVDLEELYIKGDTASSDVYLALLNGILKSATTNVVAGGTVTVARSLLKAMVKAIPVAALRLKKNMRFLTSVDCDTDYRDLLADRGTVVGDRAVLEDAPVMYSGIPIVPIPMFPDNLGGGTNETNIILTDPKNIHAGVLREMTLEREKDISAREWKFVISMRVGLLYEHEPFVVKATAVKTQ
jgi:hypothetical protein